MPPPITAEIAAEDQDISLSSLPQAWLRTLITSHLDSASVALLQSCRTLCNLVIDTAPSTKLQIDVSDAPVPVVCGQGRG
jgi:hypothetical protein